MMRDFMKYIARLILSCLLIFASFQAHSQFGGGGVSLFGPTSVNLNSYQNYNILSSNDDELSDPIFSITGGTLVSQTNSSVRVRWTSAGNGRVTGSVVVNGGNRSLMSLAVTVNATPPSTPTSPAVSSNTCGNKTLTRGNPPSGVTWYWQTSSGGTSTGNSNSTYTVTYSRTIYLRARGNSTGLWSSSRAKSVTVNPKPGTPASPSISNQCGSTILTKGSSPSGITWYWQTSSGGTSTGNSNTDWTRTSSGTVYLRARNNSSGCWSNSRSISVSINTVPGIPSDPTVQNNCGNTVLTRTTPPSGITWYWHTNATGTGTSNSATTLTRTEGGTVYLRARNNSTGCWGNNRVINVTVNESIDIPPSPSIQNNCGSTILTRSNPPSEETWYWQTSSSGTDISNSGPTWTQTTSGTVFLRARSSSSGCWSSSRSIPVAVTASPGVPPAPSVDHNCGNTVLTRTSHPNEETLYWQTSSDGTSISNSDLTWTSATAGTVYLRSQNNLTGCWGSSVSTTFVVDIAPSTPILLTINNVQEGGKELVKDATPSGEVWYWQTSSDGTSTSNLSDSFIVMTSGTYYLRSRSDLGCWGSSLSIPVTLEAQVPGNVSSSELGTDAVTINWQGNGNETAFIIRRSSTIEGPYTTIKTADVGTVSYRDENLIPDTDYYYQLQSRVNGEYSFPTSGLLVRTHTIASRIALEHSPQFNGNISAVKWNTGNGKKIYTYQYDPMNRIKSASYGEEGVANYWNVGTGNYQLHSINYDLNGNIKSLTRNGKNKLIDDLIYEYGTHGNQLQYVEDIEAEVEGFSDGHTGTSADPDYEYDHNGNMIKDLNKDIVSITYNHLNLPEVITKGDGRYIEYIYDASGIKLSQTVYEANGDVQKRTDYLGEFIYETDASGNTELVLVQHEEGRVVPDELEGDWDYEYYLKDHLGNTRAMFTSDPKTIDFTLNYENDPGLPDDQEVFDNLNNIIAADIHDHTDPGNVYDQSQLLNGAEGSVVGSVLTIPVGQGDKVEASVYAKYLASTTTANPVAAVGSLVINAITGSTGINNYEGSINGSYGTSGSMATGVFGDEINSTEPMAFINLLFLPDDVSMSIEDSYFAFSQITSASGNNHALLALEEPYEAPANGYVVVYLSNESTNLTEVYFDDMIVTVNEHPVIEKTDYYPFGLQHHGGFQRVTAKENRFKYNGKERITDLDLNWDDFGARMYMADIGRWGVIDPLSEASYDFSPYHFANNNPILYNDPTGMIGENFMNSIATTVVNEETGETYEVDDGYDFEFTVSADEFAEITESESIKGTSAYNRWFWTAVGHEMQKPSGNTLVDQLLQFFYYDDIGGGMISASNEQYAGAAIIIAAGKLKHLKKLKKWIKANPGKKLPGTKKGAATFKNREGKLPTKGKDGKPVSYQEYDVNSTPAGKTRDAERMVVGSDGKTYYTNDHYKTFKEIKD